MDVQRDKWNDLEIPEALDPSSAQAYMNAAQTGDPESDHADKDQILAAVVCWHMQQHPDLWEPLGADFIEQYWDGTRWYA